MIKDALNKILRGENLSVDESRMAIENIMDGEVSQVVTSSFLTALRCKGETVEEILGAARAMRSRVRRIPHNQSDLFDNCGTGGDGAGTFNISTTASFVIAGCGLKVAKHGNRSVSSKCGSADLLEALGANLNLSPEQSGQSIDEIGIGFLFAPRLHPAMKAVAPVRKELGIRTIFNLLGPLTNPAFASHQLIGVFDAMYVEKIARVASRLGIRKTMTVYNDNRIDEITTAGDNQVFFADNGTIKEFIIKPDDYCFDKCSVSDLAGGNAVENAVITRAILKGHEGPKRDTVVLTTAAALMVAGKASDIEQGIVIAADCIDSGKADMKLKSLIEFTKALDNAE